MIASFSYGTIRKQNTSPTTDISAEGTRVGEPLHKKKKNITIIYLVE